MNYYSLLLCLVLVAGNGTFAQSTSDKHLQAGNAHFNNGKFEKAAACYTKSIAKYPNNVNAYIMRGNARVATQQYTLAISDFTMAWELDKEHVAILVNRGNCYSALKDYESALADYKTAETLDPTELSIYYNRAHVYDKMESYELAIADYTKCIELAGPKADFYQRRSDAYHYLGDELSAMKDIENVLSVEPDHILALNNLGYIYIQFEEYEKAVEIFIRREKLGNLDTYFFSNYGYALFMTGKQELGIEYVTKALDLNPKNSYACKYLALMMLAKNDLTAACEWINKGIALGYTTKYDNALVDLKAEHCK